jgi:phenylacetate-CoA ligase
MLIVRGVNVFPSAVRDVVAGFAPRVSGHVRIRPRRPGVKQDPPLPVAVELPAGSDPDPRVADEIGRTLRERLVFQAEVELVPWGSLGRSEYKSQLVERADP